ncbi:FAD-dependent oxidoreductase [Acetonema longum]|uniref:Glucose inhibited division protein a n=1 Tax=Acetonema longum DSM 6540 TaxID=1009370 RepID=F7NMD8_9FIRM|nr:FAD-dependent oxidoreductase [Acetonema longum]EGO62814.1 glucose inhibited division protein a [Acetonema longum DSM 6540]
MAPKVIVVGGGWAGCAAALAARKTGCGVELFERTDMLLGTGLVGGIMRNNGRFTAAEEMIALGGGELFAITDKVSRHQNIMFPGHRHVSLYDVARAEPEVRHVLREAGITLRLQARVKDIQKERDRITAVIATSKDGDIMAEGDVFVDAAGTAGPPGNCTKYGYGCVMCIYRCPTFGPRLSIAAKAGVREIIGLKADGSIGAMSGSCKLHKDSLAPEIVKELNETGVVIVPVPPNLQKNKDSLSQKACQQYALAEFAENVILLDTGHAKLMSPYYPLDLLRQIPGFENARFEDPYAGGIGNSMRFVGMLPRNNALKVKGLNNVFCGGEKAGLLVGHTEAIITGTLAGYNAGRTALGQSALELPGSLACGDAIAFVRESMQTKQGLTQKYTFSGSVYFERMKEKHLYTTDIHEIRTRVETAGLKGVFAERI